MTITIDKTSKRYYGKMASDYEANRRKQGRWKLENEHVEHMLRALKPKSVLDVPVGTGRFIPVYDSLRIKRVVGVDVSDEMLALAKQKRVKHIKPVFIHSSVLALDLSTAVEVSVCVRFLDLIDERAMRKTIVRLIKGSTRAVICTIRLGPKYIAKVNTATHDEKQFRALLRSHGWKIAKDIPVFTLGWHILLLKPR